MTATFNLEKFCNEKGVNFYSLARAWNRARNEKGLKLSEFSKNIEPNEFEFEFIMSWIAKQEKAPAAPPPPQPAKTPPPSVRPTPEAPKPEKPKPKPQSEFSKFVKKLTFWDCLNGISIIFASFGFVAKLGNTGYILSLFLSVAFLGCIKEFKDENQRLDIKYLSFAGAFIIEVFYGYIHNYFFHTLINDKEEPFYFAVLLSFFSLLSALNTLLKNSK